MRQWRSARACPIIATLSRGLRLPGTPDNFREHDSVRSLAERLFADIRELSFDGTGVTRESFGQLLAPLGVTVHAL